MPIVINEIVIKATLAPAEAERPQAPPATGATAAADLKALVEAVNEAVLKALAQEKER